MAATTRSTLGSADWMPRNLFERCEVGFPIQDPALRTRVKTEILDAYLADTVKTRMLRPDGVYSPAGDAAERGNQPVFHAQDFLLAVAEESKTAESIPHNRFSLERSKPTGPQRAAEPDSTMATTDATVITTRKTRRRKPLRADA